MTGQSRMDRLIAALAACRRCGQEHKPSKPTSPYEAPNWGDPADGHSYSTLFGRGVVDWARAWAKENP